ncbi:DUF2934 domain-containing protein [Rhizobium sp. NXC24]|uniref:DUF2934 domain-containing protein n=1 Tax=Rhizobium sp. NXC24 TaxID=2048897 RepID=UPI000CDF369F|nr:DUF2934 domain-containing protein [Rhizobium sp. NXC24]AVA25628.1 hypothetical protein NXC24_PC01187 [Rhizobium sp. NXC24]
MTDDRMNWINARAYDLWERAGRPQGKDQEHWLQAVAERELMEQTRASHDGAEVLARYAATAKIKAEKSGRRQMVLIVKDEPVLSLNAAPRPLVKPMEGIHAQSGSASPKQRVAKP